MAENTRKNEPGHPWDDNLPKNKEYIQNFYQKSENQIQQNTGEGNVLNPTENSGASNWENSTGSTAQNLRKSENTGETYGNPYNSFGSQQIQQARITKVRKNSSGDITDVMIDTGNVYSINEAIVLAKDGVLSGVNVGKSKNGKEVLRGNPNGDPSDNLDNLPTF